jgi:pimeloyl-ACP methyl ester carboxylesterase
MSPRGWLSVILLVPTLACSTPIGVKRVSAQQVHRSLTANVLSTGRASEGSTQILNRLELFELHRTDPDAALSALRESMLEKQDRTDLLSALAELEFLRARRLRRADARPHYLASAVYAYAFFALLSRSDLFVAVDPRFRLAADLYNRGLTSGLATDDGERVNLEPRTVSLPFGSLVLEIDEDEFLWAGYRMGDFVPVAELEVRGLRNRYRRAGVGAPLAAALEPADLEKPPPGFRHIANDLRVAATATVGLSNVIEGLRGGVIHAQVQIHTLDEATSLQIGDERVPLEYEPTAALAFGLTESRPWDFEVRGFFSGDFGGEQAIGLRMLGPYDAKRIPIVLVHGTVSSRARWAEMINDLQADSAILARYQFWIFQYNSGNPITFSAGRLRQSLTDLVAELDPQAKDPNLRRMVIIGHSQGGLLTKLCVVESGDAFWGLVSTVPIDELDLRPETHEVLERSLFFHPLPFVERVIFIATPHGGSFLAERRLARFAAGFVTMPREILDTVGDLFSEDDDRLLIRNLDDISSSIENMTPGTPFLTTLASLQVVPSVHAHSIIAVLPGHEPVETGHDGSVAFESARLAGVTSEHVVRSGHSTQRHPGTISEVRRILLEKLAAPGH